MNEYRKKQHELMIDNSNMKMMQRITAVKATIGDWDKREKKLHSYRKLSQKSYEGKKQ